MAATGPRYVVVGAGFGGISAAEMLSRAGIDFTVYERAGEVGGTWRDNTYPGLYVDVPSRQYEFPFHPNYDWSRRFAPAPEIQEYIKRVVDERNLRRFIRFNEEIVSADFIDGRWHVKTARGETDVADVFLACTGFLSVPVIPDIPGRDRFAGTAFHSACWDHSVPIEGKRWGVIGSGASGVQITEALAWRDCNVTQFLRRPQWVWISENPHTTPAERAALREPGAYERVAKELWDGYSVSDRWRLEPGPLRETMEQMFKGFLEGIRDPVLKQKLTPDYHVGCTRLPKSDQNYYEAVQRPNVTIETGKIAAIEPRGIRLADGRLSELDVLVYATGYDAHAYMRPIKVTGLNGVTIEEAWKQRIYSYRGVAMPGFPNLFMLYGPFSPVNNLSVPIGMLQELEYIMRVVDFGRARNAAVMPSVAATERFLARIEAALPNTVWVGCRNWYSDQTGTPILWPLPQDDHTEMMRDLAIEDLEFVPVPSGVAAQVTFAGAK